MRGRGAMFAAVALVAVLAWAPGAAHAAFGLKTFDVTFTDENGASERQAGAHPFAMTTSFEVNTRPDPERGEIPDGAVRDLIITQIEGLAGNPTATPRCSTLEFLDHSGVETGCANSTAVGITRLWIGRFEDKEEGELVPAPVHNLVPPPGVAAKLGFWALTVPVTIEIGVKEAPPYNIVARVANINQTVPFFGSELTVWGNPADSRHDDERGSCASGGGDCDADIPEKPFLTLPRSCEGPLATSWEADSWQEPGKWVSGSVLTHNDATPPTPTGFIGCGALRFAPRIGAQPTTTSAESATGLEFNLRIDDENLTNPEGTAGSDLGKAVVTLPEGMTVNPSQAEGLGVCTEADLAREKANTPPGAGCPNESKIGTIEVQTPLLEEKTLTGSLHVAEPYQNPFDSLIALYMVFRSPELGIVITQAAEVTPDPRTGQLRTTVEDIPQLPFSDFRLRFREGARSPLVTPPRCGTHTVVAQLTPRANPSATVVETSSFQVTSGPGGAPCPAGGVPPFRPGFTAGTLSNDAGSFSPFLMRLTRRDGDQDMTKFSATLPEGLVGKLAGVSQCAPARIALAKSKTGLEEKAGPSCPANSRIGGTLAGAGVGSALTYVPGSLYLAGPYKGAPLSVVAVTPAVAGPFDAGTVVVRVGLKLNQTTAQVEVDGAASDPIPHILQGIVLKLRELRVNVDRPSFTLNPTNCTPAQLRAALFGSFANVLDPSDDVAVTLIERFQAADCAALGFRPRLGLRLKGGTRRGAFPALRAVFRPRPGQANLSRLALHFPRSAFIEQGHFRTICTRVQDAADTCPRGSVYGRVRAFTPLLDQPLEGNVYLRSSNNELPDAVFDLRGIVDVEVVVRIDSVRGRLRAIVAKAPDVPVSHVVVNMRGGQKGLFTNSRNLCAGKSRAAVALKAHNGKRATLRPVVRAPGCKRGGKRR